MTSDHTYDAPGPTGFDPACLAELVDEIGEGPYLPPERLAFGLERLAAETDESAGEASARCKALQVLARVCSPMLVPDNWNEPFEPMIRMDGRRSVLPEDFSEEELSLLADIAPQVIEPTIRARAADVAWAYGDRQNQAMWQLAVDSYFAVPLDPESWMDVGKDSYRRGLELALRRGKPGVALAQGVADRLLDLVLAPEVPDRWMLVEVSELLATTRRLDGGQAEALAERLLELASGSDAPRRARALAREASSWFQSAKLPDRAHHATEVIAELYLDEAESRLGGDAGAMVAGHFLEKAISMLRGLPRRYRSAHGVEPWLRSLQALLADVREESLEQMMVISSDPIDITAIVAQSQAFVVGRTRLDALIRLTSVARLTDLDQAVIDERTRLTGSLSQLFGGVTYSHDARKVATHGGLSGAELTDDVVEAELVGSFPQRIGLTVQAQIYPALQTIAFEHRWDLPFLTMLCVESPLVPPGHEQLWARGLQHGLAGDFPSAISVLVPQLEELIRQHFKSHQVFTRHVADDGVEKEKSIGALLEMYEATDLLGANLAFELRALLVEQRGSNLRNDLAHGLLTDAQTWGSAAVYAWWHCLRLVVLPLASMRQQEGATDADV
ncbi:DUF4209 domain-containing protein [Nocardioides bruguierae]|uniref:DUF4209 domain-containing protein n=1 Tax=Nocardioides bruguierae TaxID=2945102 RepID=UPI00201FF8E7|nr:DUF4209 domain-containing protein [Nocardioides bruguierae]MCL8027347.1 DUF4209 domain-containing protein [Nocardioides bruguierae]